MNKKCMTRASGIINVILYSLLTLLSFVILMFGIMFVLGESGIIPVSFFVSDFIKFIGKTIEELNLIYMFSIGSFIWTSIIGAISLGLSITCLVFAAKTIKYSKYDVVKYSKKKGAMITYLVFFILFAGAMAYNLYLTTSIFSIVTLSIQVIAFTLLIVDMALNCKCLSEKTVDVTITQVEDVTQPTTVVESITSDNTKTVKKRTVKK